MAGNDQVPVEPSAALRHMASTLRQTYMALLGVGFTKSEALTIVGHVIAAGVQHQQRRDAGG